MRGEGKREECKADFERHVLALLAEIGGVMEMGASPFFSEQEVPVLRRGPVAMSHWIGEEQEEVHDGRKVRDTIIGFSHQTENDAQGFAWLTISGPVGKDLEWSLVAATEDADWQLSSFPTVVPEIVPGDWEAVYITTEQAKELVGRLIHGFFRNAAQSTTHDA